VARLLLEVIPSVLEVNALINEQAVEVERVAALETLDDAAELFGSDFDQRVRGDRWWRIRLIRVAGQQLAWRWVENELIRRRGRP
jgi:hypothetical protein